MTVEQDVENLKLEVEKLKKQVLEDPQRKELSITTSLSRHLVDVGLSPCASMRQNSAQSVNNATWTKITMDTKIFDFMGDSVKLDTDRIIVRRGGIYLVIGQVRFASGDADGSRYGSVYVNGAAAEGSGEYGGYTSLSTEVIRAPALALVSVRVNDYFELWGFQNSGAALNTEVTAPRSFLSAILLSRGS